MNKILNISIVNCISSDNNINDNDRINNISKLIDMYNNLNQLDIKENEIDYYRETLISSIKLLSNELLQD